MQYMFPVILMAGLIGFAVFRMSKMSGAMAAAGPALQSFYQRTGYRYVGMAPEPLEAHVQRAMADLKTMTSQGGERRCVRIYQGVAVEWVEGTEITATGFSFWTEWSALRTAPPRVLFHIADRSLSGAARAIGEMMSNVRSSWGPRYPHPVVTGIPQLDQRFVVFSPDPNAAAAFFQHNPALVTMLLGCTQVDLWTDPQRAAFSDPMQKNLLAATGTTFDVGQRLERSLPVHEHIAAILATTVQAS